MAIAANAAPRAHRHLKPSEVADALTKAKGMISVAARSLGCDPETIRRHIKRSPICAAALNEARELILDISELALYKAIQEGEGWAIKYILSTQGKCRGYVEAKPTDIREQAKQLAEAHGFDPDEVIREAERIVGGR